MKRVKTLFVIILMVIFMFCGCVSKEVQLLKAENEQLKENIKRIEEEKKSLQMEISVLSSELNKNIPSVTYCTYKDKQRFVQKELDILLYPQKGAPPLNTILPNTVVQVLDSGIPETEERELWLYVIIPTYDCPINNRGWIRESDTVPITKENQKLIQSNVWVKKGTEIYEVFEFDKISTTTPTKLAYDASGRLEEKRDGYARISCAGGWDFWVEEKYVIYPSVE